MQDPLSLLDERLARGDIDLGQYRALRDELSRRPGGTEPAAARPPARGGKIVAALGAVAFFGLFAFWQGQRRDDVGPKDVEKAAAVLQASVDERARSRPADPRGPTGLAAVRVDGNALFLTYNRPGYPASYSAWLSLLDSLTTGVCENPSLRRLVDDDDTRVFINLTEGNESLHEHVSVGCAASNEPASEAIYRTLKNNLPFRLNSNAVIEEVALEDGRVVMTYRLEFDHAEPVEGGTAAAQAALAPAFCISALFRGALRRGVEFRIRNIDNQGTELFGHTQLVCRNLDRYF